MNKVDKIVIISGIILLVAVTLFWTSIWVYGQEVVVVAPHDNILYEDEVDNWLFSHGWNLVRFDPEFGPYLNQVEIYFDPLFPPAKPELMNQSEVEEFLAQSGRELVSYKVLACGYDCQVPMAVQIIAE